MSLSGVFCARKKDGTEYFRASVTYKEKHISLGSFDTEEAAGAAYAFAKSYLNGDEEYLPEKYEEVIQGKKENEGESLAFDKWIMLLNFKKTGIYCKNPIYIYGNYFDYYLERHLVLKFGTDEFFFFGKHKLQKRGGHIFYSDYGMQCGLLNRYGVKNYSVEGRDYVFKNGDHLDFRYGNLVIINKYNGVFLKERQGRKKYEVLIHLRGSLKVGIFRDETEAAIAYNKAADSLEEAIRKKNHGNVPTTVVENNILRFKKKNRLYNVDKTPKIKGNTIVSFKLKSQKNPDKTRLLRYRRWKRNYVDGLSRKDYIEIYEKLELSRSFNRFLKKM